MEKEFIQKKQKFRNKKDTFNKKCPFYFNIIVYDRLKTTFCCHLVDLIFEKKI